MTSAATRPAKKPTKPAGSPKRRTLARLLALNRPHLRRIGLAALCVLGVNGALLAKPYILKVVIDDFLMRRTAQHGLYSLTGLGVAYFAVVLLGGALKVAQTNLINRAGQEVMRTLRRNVFRTIQLLPLRLLDKTSSGSLITRATNDVEALSQLYTDVLISLFQDVFLILGIVVTMLLLDVRLALVSFCVVPFLFALVFFLKTTIKRNFRRMKTLIGRINGFMAETLSGVRLIQTFHAERERKADFSTLNNEYFKVTSFQVFMNSFLKPAANVFQSLAVAILIAYGMGKVGSHTLEIGVLYAFTNYIKQFFDPVADLADNYTSIQSAFVSADRIFELLDQKDSLEDLDEGIDPGQIGGTIEFDHVWFAYEGENWVLKDVSFVLQKGQTAAFVGQTGAGKTTIISLVSGFYRIQRGEIRIDGVNINDIQKRALRRGIAVVLQDVFLFSGTVGENVSLNDPIAAGDIDDAIETACAGDFVRSFSAGTGEPVMERGSTFSAGQRQLLSFARAIAHEPSIIVLDEATANIDSQTEILIQKAIENVARDRTTLIIAHRLSTIRGADVILVLDHGRVVETGRHDELMAARGPYSAMIREGLNA